MSISPLNVPQGNEQVKRLKIEHAALQSSPPQAAHVLLPSVTWGRHLLIAPVIEHILRYVTSYRDLLNFERLAKGYDQYTKRRWTELRRAQQQEFDLACFNLPQKQQPEMESPKWQYLVKEALLHYVTRRHQITFSNKKAVEAVYKCYQHFMLLFPPFGRYLWTDLSHQIRRWLSPHQAQLEQHPFNPQNANIKGGDFLLEALYRRAVFLKKQRKVKDSYLSMQKEVFPLLQEAIRRRTTDVTFLDYYALTYNSPDCGFVSIPDFGDLFKIGHFYSSLIVQEDSQRTHQVPPLLLFFAAYAFDETQSQEADDLYTRTLARQADFARPGISLDTVLPQVLSNQMRLNTKQRMHPLDHKVENFCIQLLAANRIQDRAYLYNLLCVTAVTKCRLGKWQEAKKLALRALESFRPRVLLDNLILISSIFMNLHEWKEAESYYDQIIASRIDFPAKVWANAGFVKAKLEKYDEADELYIQALALYKNEVPVEVLGQAGFVKVKLCKWKEAESLYARARAVCEIDRLFWVLVYGAIVKFKLGKKEEAENLFMQGVNSFYHHLDAWFLEKEDEDALKFGLTLDSEAEQLLLEVKNAYQDRVPACVLAIAANINFVLRNLKEANALYEMAMTAFGNEVPPFFFAFAALLQSALGQEAKAEMFFDQALQIYGNDLPRHLLVSAAFHKIQVNKIDEGETLVTRSMEGYKASVPVFIMGIAIAIKIKLGKWQEVEDLCARAISDHKRNISAWVLLNSAIAKFKQHKRQEFKAMLIKVEDTLVAAIPEALLSVSGEDVKKKYPGNWELIEILFVEIMQTYGNDVPAYVLTTAAGVNALRRKVKEAEALYEKAMKVYGDHVPASLFANAAFVKCQLEKWQEAEALYEKAVAAYGNGVPPWVLLGISKVSVCLGNLPKAEEFSHRAIEAFEHDVPACVLSLVVYIKARLSNWQEAEALSVRAIERFGKEVPAYLLRMTGTVKSMLSQWNEAAYFYQRAFETYQARGEAIPPELRRSAALIADKIRKIAR